MKLLNMRKQFITIVLSFILLGAIIVNIFCCSVFTISVKANDLMEGVSSKSICGKSVDNNFITNTADFSIELFKESSTEDKNSLISPMSVLLSLAMTANGADNETLMQIQAVIGGDIPLDELNEYLYSFANSLQSGEKSKLNISNSIWFRNDENSLTVENDFLQKNADYYNASAYKSTFNGQTVKDINNWVKTNTDGMIDEIINKIDPNAMIYLINAIVFDAEWQTIYYKKNIKQGKFTANDKSEQNADYMHSTENIYLDDGKAIGFIKPYTNNKYSFVALLPSEGISINEYVSSLSGEGFIDIIKNAEKTEVIASLPKFSYDYTINMNNSLIALGMPIAFSSAYADFNRLGKSSEGNIYIGEVLHKTFISVDELGTKAGAVTKIGTKAISESESTIEPKIVTLDRPFVYAIIDNATNLPVFIGTIMSLED